ncbi:hypothetical protein [Mycolicibacterium palauense]|uniref:hypothetical protein n=1 Tax=Mycolicibacterium palauense TaxID=2034511 RepID=UPI000BFF135C|nr:hypothetical protein [Mycolicibacterium palauense]
MRRGERWVDIKTGEVHTVNWWAEGQYWPWNPWYTSVHMIWAAPAAICGVGVVFALLVAVFG